MPVLCGGAWVTKMVNDGLPYCNGQTDGQAGNDDVCLRGSRVRLTGRHAVAIFVKQI
jgi:hypothetical protein